MYITDIGRKIQMEENDLKFMLKESVERGYIEFSSDGYKITQDAIDLIEDSTEKSKATFAQMHGIKDFDDLSEDKKQEYYSINKLSEE